MEKNGYRYKTCAAQIDRSISSSGNGLGLPYPAQIYVRCFSCEKTIALIPSCGSDDAVDSLSDKEVREHFESHGWTFEGQRNKCPEHSK